jgi:hypothetical protein
MTHCIGQIAKIMTTADQSVRVWVDIPRESVPADMLSLLGEMVIVSHPAMVKAEN